jgi:hypothetical protein
MPTLAVLATIADHSTRAFTLTVGGNDMDITGERGEPWTIDRDSIVITETDISTMTLRIWDPSLVVTIPDMAEIVFHDVTNDLTLFRGFVQAATPTLAAVGRFIDVRCVGVEAVLDWMLVPSLTIPSGTRTSAAIQSVLANATGIGYPLHATSSPTKDGYQGDATYPVASFATAITTTELNVAVVLAGESVRQALDIVFASSLFTDYFAGATGDILGTATVDFTTGLRAYDRTLAPTDYVTLEVSDAPTGSQVAATGIADLSIGLAVVRGVYVKGGNAAGTGLVPDGTGKIGPIAFIDDSTITTTAGRNAAAFAYLAAHGDSAAGSLTLENLTPTTNIRAGSRLTLTSTQLGLAAADYAITSIRKRFVTTSRQDWEVSYGAVVPSGTRVMRQFTRFVRS